MPIGVSHNCLHCGLTNKTMNVPMYYKNGGMLTGNHVFRNAIVLEQLLLCNTLQAPDGRNSSSMSLMTSAYA